jgi:hypothetical protein
MKISIQTLLLVSISIGTTSAFTPTLTSQRSSTHLNVNKQQHKNNEQHEHHQHQHQQHTTSEKITNQMKNIMSSTFMAVALWSSPPSALLSSNNDISNNFLMNNEIVRTTLVADAKEMASGSGSRVNKDPESLLRLGLPIPKDKEVCLCV